MSWDGYLDNIVAQANDPTGQSHVDRACIIGLDNGASWTTSEHPRGIKIVGTEAVTLASAVRSGQISTFQQNGIVLEGVKYMFLQQNGNMFLGKKKDHGAISLQKTKTAIVVAHCPEGKQQGMANKAVAAIADYLEGMNM